MSMRLVKTGVFICSLLPLLWIFYLVIFQQLGADPAIHLTQILGLWALRFLCLSLAITPIRLLTGINKMIRLRRMLGLFCLFYAVLHLLAYLFFVLQLDWANFFTDLGERPYIIVGALAFFILLLLGLSSFKFAIKNLGKYWVLLHKGVYFAAIFIIIHFFWLIRSEYSEVFLYAIILVFLFFIRFFFWAKKKYGASKRFI